MSVSRELHAIGQSFFQILNEMMRSARMSSPDEPAGHKLGLWVKCLKHNFVNKFLDNLSSRCVSSWYNEA
jgi:hypothetical protein